jgi:hypothetical protein
MRAEGDHLPSRRLLGHALDYSARLIAWNAPANQVDHGTVGACVNS